MAVIKWKRLLQQGQLKTLGNAMIKERNPNQPVEGTNQRKRHTFRDTFILIDELLKIKR